MRPAGLAARLPARQLSKSRVAMRVRAEDTTTTSSAPSAPVGDNSQPPQLNDSYSRIEAPVRGGEGAPGTIPDGGPPVATRFNEIDRILINNDGQDERAILGNEIAFPDAFRFKGAAPEIINSRLAMLGFVAAIGAEAASHQGLLQQFKLAPLPIAATFLLFTVASLVPISKGVPRKGGKDWGGLPQFTPDAELVNGRIAMLGIVGLIIADKLAGGSLL